MICTGSPNCSREAGRQVGMAGRPRCAPHRAAGAGRAAPVTVMSSCTAYTSSLDALREGGVEQQPLLQRGQRQHVGDLVLPAAARRSAAGSAGPARYRTASARRHRRCTCAQMPASASNHSRLSRSTWSSSSAEGAHVQLACSCGPASVSMVPALSSTVCINGIGTADGRRGDRQSVLRLIRHRSSDSSPAPAPRRPEVVEPDRRIRPAQVDVGVQVAQQTVGQPVGQGAQLLLGVLDHRAQRGVTGHHLRPGQLHRRPATPGTWW